MNPSCHGKTRYRTFKDAQSVAKWQSRRHDEPFKAYHCVRCQGFHTAEGKSEMPDTRRSKRSHDEDVL